MNPTWAEVEDVLNMIDAPLAGWQKAMIASVLSGPASSLEVYAGSRRTGKNLADEWTKRCCHLLSHHVHFIGPDTKVCVGAESTCPGWTPYNPVEEPNVATNQD